ncbi:hypothetical protein OKW50_008356 [Paraburkholderia youngii]|uniref:DUF3892 domain-containing protein n=2 Tax=Paraburkholderia youngii TaxID=2782701 RepID=UPI003D2586C8
MTCVLVNPDPFDLRQYISHKSRVNVQFLNMMDRAISNPIIKSGGFMAQRIQVLCIRKTKKQSRHEAISHIGGKNPDGSRWKISEKDAINGIETGRWSFYVVGGGQTADVLVWQTPQGQKFLRTGHDVTIADNLLSLPQCR